MFILYAVLGGVAIGLALGGHLEHLATIRLRWLPLAVLGLLVQLALFTDAGWAVAGELGPLIYAASTAAVLVVVVANVRVPGLALVAIGAASNLAAILANGGSMPADPAALASLGLTAGGATNSVVVPDPALQPLTDIFAMPAWLPLANVFSIGDVLIGAGIAIAIAASMRRPAAPPHPAGAGRPAASIGSDGEDPDRAVAAHEAAEDAVR